MEDKSLFESGQYEKIIKKYEFEKKELDSWSLYWLSRSYYKLQRYTECIKTYNVYKTLNLGKDNLKSICMWAYYNIMKTKKSKEELIKLANYIVDNCEQGDFSPYEKTVDYVIKFLEDEKTVFNKEEIYEWLKILNPNLLSKEPYIIKKDGRAIELASKYEKYYVLKSKCEYDLGLYAECIETCNLALKNLVEFHTDNDIWFNFKISKSLKELGNLNEAKDNLERIGKLNKHFAIKTELGDILMKLGEMDEAEKVYIEGLVSEVGSLTNKVNLIEKTGDVLLENDDLENAKLNYLLSKKIRDENNWKTSPALMNKINDLRDVHIDIKEKEILNACINKWHEGYYKSLEKGEGTVVSVLKNNRGGFIQFGEENMYFSSKELRETKIEKSVNKKVKFYIIDGYNKKKKEIQKEAINIKVIENKE